MIKKKNHTHPPLPPTRDMRFYFGFPNVGDISRLSPNLVARNINYLKAPPSSVPIVAFPDYRTDAAEIRSIDLTGQSYANDTNRTICAESTFHPVSIVPAHCLPLAIPPLYFETNEKNKGKAKIEDVGDTQQIQSKALKPGEKGYQVPFSKGIRERIRRLNPVGEKSASVPNGLIHFEHYDEYVTIWRVISSAIRTLHPAWKAPGDEALGKSKTSFGKRLFSPTQEAETMRSGKRREIDVLTYAIGATTVSSDIMEEGEVSEMEEVSFRVLKPMRNGADYYGQVGSIPQNYEGALFPYIPDLAVYDPEGVVSFLESVPQYMGDSPKTVTDNLRRIVKAWKGDICRSSTGNIFSHLVAGIKIARSGRTGIFPIFDKETYVGFYIFGSHFTMYSRDMVIKPVSFTDNREDLLSLSSFDKVIEQIMDIAIGPVSSVEGNTKKIQGTVAAATSLRSLEQWLDMNVAQTPEMKRKIKEQVALLKYDGGFMPLNPENLKLCFEFMLGKKDIPVEMAMHSDAWGNDDPIVKALSMFGYTVPSPHIPGAPTVSFAGDTAPGKTTKNQATSLRVIAFRRTLMDLAVSDWSKFFESGTAANNPRNLNKRFNYLSFNGENAAEEMWIDLNRLFKAMKEKKGEDFAVIEGAELKETEEIDGFGVVGLADFE